MPSCIADILGKLDAEYEACTEQCNQEHTQNCEWLEQAVELNTKRLQYDTCATTCRIAAWQGQSCGALMHAGGFGGVVQLELVVPIGPLAETDLCRRTPVLVCPPPSQKKPRGGRKAKLPALMVRAFILCARSVRQKVLAHVSEKLPPPPLLRQEEPLEKENVTSAPRIEQPVVRKALSSRSNVVETSGAHSMPRMVAESGIHVIPLPACTTACGVRAARSPLRVDSM